MRIIGLTGLTCVGKSTAVETFEELGWYPIDIGASIRRVHSKFYLEQNVFDFTLESHEMYGKTWSLSRAFEKVDNEIHNKIIISGIRFKEQIDFLKRIDSNFLLINISSQKEYRLGRFMNRQRTDTNLTEADFKYKDEIEMKNYDIELCAIKSEIEIENNSTLSFFSEEIIRATNRACYL